MNIIYADWNCFGGRDILEALSDMEYQIHIIGLSKSARYGQDTEYTDRLVNCIKDKMLIWLFPLIIIRVYLRHV